MKYEEADDHLLVSSLSLFSQATEREDPSECGAA